MKRILCFKFRTAHLFPIFLKLTVWKSSKIHEFIISSGFNGHFFALIPLYEYLKRVLTRATSDEFAQDCCRCETPCVEKPSMQIQNATSQTKTRNNLKFKRFYLLQRIPVTIDPSTKMLPPKYWKGPKVIQHHFTYNFCYKE